jgi:pimeloyl-ACP methyl ester carboxylesterase
LKNVKRIVLLALALSASMRPVSAQPAIDAAFKRFWDAKNPQEAAVAAAAVVKARPAFDDAYARLKKGRTYSSTAPHGVVRLSHLMADSEFPYTLDVPPAYDASKKYQARVQLHGGIGRPGPLVRGDGSIGALAGAEQIYVLPTSWNEAPWWGELQVASLRVILDALKRTYNVDENRIVVSGVSDGGTGVYYVAMKDTTPYASFLPLNGFLMVLANPSLELTEQLFPQNLINKPFFVVNGGEDPLYPEPMIAPYIRHMQKGGGSVDYHPQPNAGHNTSWWPQVKDTFEAFVRSHPRDPLPSRLTWETGGAPGMRAHWLVIDKLEPRRAATPLADLNEFPSGTEPNFGVRSSGMKITAVLAGSNAEAIGLKPDDLVVSINGRKLPAALDLLEFLGLYNAGDQLALGVTRGDKAIEVSGIYDPRPMIRMVPLFPRGGASGRVDLVREGNTVRATTRGVAAFTLLASPDAFDFSQPVTVIVDGQTMFTGRLQRSLATLMKWAAIDNDRTMLFAAEIALQVK